jgi:hypothetical protein
MRKTRCDRVHDFGLTSTAPSSTASTDCGGFVEGSANALAKALSARQHRFCCKPHCLLLWAKACALNALQSCHGSLVGKLVATPRWRVRYRRDSRAVCAQGLAAQRLARRNTGKKIMFAALALVGVCGFGSLRVVAQHSSSQPPATADISADVFRDQQFALLRKDIRSQLSLAQSQD